MVIPTRDRCALLSAALDSSLGQRDVDLEVVVVDDGSRDGTPDLLAGTRDPRLRWTRAETGGGLGRLRNLGIGLARGRWLAFRDDDDLWAPWKLRRQLDLARASGATFVYGPVAVLDADGRRRTTLAAPDPAGLAERLLVGNAMPAGSSNVLADRSAVLALGGFDERLSHLADWDLWLRLALAGGAAADAAVLVAYVRHPGTMFLSSPDGVDAEFALVEAKHAAARARRGVSPERGGAERWRAGQLAQRGQRLAAAAAYARIASRHRSVKDLARAILTMAGEGAADAARERVHRARARRRHGQEVLDDASWLRDRPMAQRRGAHARPPCG